MVKQSHHLADRPRTVAAGELLSDGMRVLTLGAGDRLKKYRRYAQEFSRLSET